MKLCQDDGTSSLQPERRRPVVIKEKQRIGGSGPKVREWDRQVPEGIYEIESLTFKTYKGQKKYGPKFALHSEYLDNQLTGWFNVLMKAVGIFEAKTKLSGLCEEVSRTRLPLLLKRRGKPLVIISPAPPQATKNRMGIWEEWKQWAGDASEEDQNQDDFPEVWNMRLDKKESPLAE